MGQRFVYLLKASYERWTQHNAPRLGAALAYYSVLSLSPLLIVVVTIAGLAFGAQAVQGNITSQIRDLVGSRGAEAVQAVLQASYKPSTGIVASFMGLVVLLYGASGVFTELRDDLNLIWEVRSPPSQRFFRALKERFFSFAMVLAIGFLLLVSLVLSAGLAAAGKFFGGLLPIPGPVLEALNLVVSLVAISFLFALIYRYVPEMKLDWKDVWIGAAVTSLLFSIGKLAIGLYLGRAGVGSAYGAAGSLVVILVWVYYSAQIFLFGAEFTKVHASEHGSEHAWQNRPLELLRKS